MSSVPKSTKANLSLRDPSEVLLILPSEHSKQCYASSVIYGYVLNVLSFVISVQRYVEDSSSNA